MSIKPAIGIVGGLGPAAGADLCLKVFKHTRASCDQEHIDLYMVSCGSLVADRTDYLLFGGEDPRGGMLLCMKKLAAMGATAIGVACNTAHSKRIMGAIDFSCLPSGVKIVNMIEETCRFISGMFRDGARIGLLSTLGTANTGVYDEYFADYPALELVNCSDTTKQKVNDAIYDSRYGIKATPKVSAKARKVLIEAIDELKSAGCEAVILGCTEIPLAISDANSPLPTIDPTDVLARSLIMATEPEKLI